MTPEEKRLKLNAIKKSRANGATVDEACKEHGVTISAFYNWQRKVPANTSTRRMIPGRLVKKPYVQEIALTPSPQRLVCLIGTPQDISRVIGTLS